MRVAGLFAGIGGLELGFNQAGCEAALMCEIDPGARGLLARHFPNTKLHGDVTTLKTLAGADIVTAGFPCQDLSSAGTRAGIDGVQSGLVDYVFDRLSKRGGPEWVVLENVPNLLRLGGGEGILRVTSQLENFGYQWAYRLLDARAFGVAQRRLRVFLVASKRRDPAPLLCSADVMPTWPSDGVFDATSPAYGFYWTEGNRGVGWAREAVPTLKGGSGFGIPSAPAVWLTTRAEEDAFVTPGIEDTEALQGFARGWTAPEEGSAAREQKHRWRYVGNAVAVPVARWIAERILANDSSTECVTRPFSGRWPDAAAGGPGREPNAIVVGSWPVSRPRELLTDVLKDPRPLSVRAAAGFFDRLQRSSLTVGPAEFREALAAYCTAAGAPRHVTTRSRVAA